MKDNEQIILIKWRLSSITSGKGKTINFPHNLK